MPPKTKGKVKMRRSEPVYLLHDSSTHYYYNDPLLKIPGTHFIAMEWNEPGNCKNWRWAEIRFVTHSTALPQD